MGANLDMDNLDLNYSNGEFYSQVQYYNSKLAQIMYFNQYARRIAKTGANIQTVSLHPGSINCQGLIIEAMHDVS